jgi:hypothetical protein
MFNSFEGDLEKPQDESIKTNDNKTIFIKTPKTLLN